MITLSSASIIVIAALALGAYCSVKNGNNDAFRDACRFGQSIFTDDSNDDSDN